MSIWHGHRKPTFRGQLEGNTNSRQETKVAEHFFKLQEDGIFHLNQTERAESNILKISSIEEIVNSNIYEADSDHEPIIFKRVETKGKMIGQ